VRKSRIAPKTARLRSSAAARQETKVAQLSYELSEARQQQTATSRSTFDLRVLVDTLIETAGRLCHADGVSIHRGKGWSSDFLPALNQTDRACNIDQPDVNTEEDR
jgi:hypothetical protein